MASGKSMKGLTIYYDDTVHIPCYYFACMNTHSNADVLQCSAPRLTMAIIGASDASPNTSHQALVRLQLLQHKPISPRSSAQHNLSYVHEAFNCLNHVDQARYALALSSVWVELKRSYRSHLGCESYNHARTTYTTLDRRKRRETSLRCNCHSLSSYCSY